MKASFMISIFVLGIFLVSACTIGGAKPKPESKLVISGSTVDINIETPHPYPNSDSGRKVVWSYKLEHPKATYLRLHFNNIQIKYGNVNPPSIYEEVDHGECDLNAPEGYKRELMDPNTIKETQIIEQQGGEVSVSSLRTIKCGIIKEKKEYTDQEIFDNNWIEGDFLLIKDRDGKVLDIIANSPFYLENKYDFWSTAYSVDTVILELYADDKENAHGLYIDKYVRGFTEEEKERINQ